MYIIYIYEFPGKMVLTEKHVLCCRRLFDFGSFLGPWYCHLPDAIPLSE